MKTPRFWYRPPGFLSTLCAPLSLVYAAGRWIDVALSRPQAFARPVICIGNGVVGGAGKTPTTMALARLLQENGFAPHIVSRGYGGSAKAPHRLQVNDTADKVGDEPLLLATVAPTWVSKNRGLGIGCAFAAGAELVLLDDGLQNTSVKAQVNIMVVDGASGFGNGQLMPAGPLREFPIELAARIDALVVIGDDTQKIAAQFPGKPVFSARRQFSQLDASKKYAAFAGLARPDNFFDSAQAQGAALVDTKSFADHYFYSTGTREKLRQWAAGLGAQLLTTAKDAMRWPANERAALEILDMQIVFDEPQAMLTFIRERTHD